MYKRNRKKAKKKKSDNKNYIACEYENVEIGVRHELAREKSRGSPEIE